jgi:diguanylate cyclase (GGDEF)-like protein
MKKIAYKYFNQGSIALISLICVLYLGNNILNLKKQIENFEIEDTIDIYKLYKKISQSYPLQSYLIKNETYKAKQNLGSEYVQFTPREEATEQKKFSLVVSSIQDTNSTQIQKKIKELGDEEYSVALEQTRVVLFAKHTGSKYVLITKEIALFNLISKLFSNLIFLFFVIFVALLMLFFMSYYESKLHLKRKKELENKYKHLEENANKVAFVDNLTQVSSRLKFMDFFNDSIQISKTFGQVFCLLMFDIDDFKKINDTYGHDYGDEVLIQVANCAKNTIRKNDLIARWGGEEFIIVLPMTDLKNAVVIAHKIRKAINRLRFTQKGQVSCSFGVVLYKNEETREGVFKRLDDLLYEAKRSGKNCVKYEKG